jgi:two-component system response regulator PhcR
VLCTLTKNALLALRGRPRPQLRIEVGCARRRRGPPRLDPRSGQRPGHPAGGAGQADPRAGDHRAASGGSGMGLMFCQRVMQAISGSIEVQSEPGQGTTVTLFFQRLQGSTPPSPKCGARRFSIALG